MNKLTIIAIVIFIIAGALLAFGLISNNNTKDTPIYNTPKETIFANLTNAYHKQNEGA